VSILVWLNALYLLYLHVKDSQPYTNRWGLNPKIADMATAGEQDEDIVEWYRKKAEQGNTEAQFTLGWMYEHGIDIPQDIRKAVEWYRPAAAQGNKSAQNALDRLK
jgi:TPR repeat protein